MSDIVISGYYGLGNSGDEALLKSIVNDLKNVKDDVSITALSANADLTNKLYGIKTVSRMNIFSIIKEFRSAKLLLSGGGTLIQDATSTKSLVYYLGIIFLAKLMGMKVMIYANGMGPLKEKNLKMVRKVLDKVDLITLRENVSYEEIERCKITKPKVLITADPAFNLEPSDKKRADEILSAYSIKSDDKLIAVSVRLCKGIPENFTDEMALTLDELSKKGYTPLLIPMQKSLDTQISMEIASKMKMRSVVLEIELAVADMLAIIGRCSIACGMRLHALIFASVMNVPMAGIVYDPKIKGFMEYMNQKNYIPLEKFNSSDFIELTTNCISNLDAIKKQLAEDSVPLRQNAQLNASLAVELLKER